MTQPTATVPVVSPPLSPVPNMIAEGARLCAVCVGLDELHGILTRDYVTAHRVVEGVPRGAKLRGLFLAGDDGNGDVDAQRMHLVFEHALFAPVALGAMIPEQQILLQEYVPALAEMRKLIRVMITKSRG